MRLIFLLLLTAYSFCATAQAVYKTPSGKKYHLASCRMVKNVSEALDVSEAVASGLGPCGICHPQVAESPRLRATPQGQSKRTTQCNGLTKAGKRCLHMTSIANGYCYQHQPK